MWTKLEPSIRDALSKALQAHPGVPAEERERALFRKAAALARAKRKEWKLTRGEGVQLRDWFIRSVTNGTPQPILAFDFRDRMVKAEPTKESPAPAERDAEADAPSERRLPFTMLSAPEDE